jgi:hypothetical protein
MIELVEGVFVDPYAVTVVKSAGKGKCVFWVTGQSALDGFHLDYDAEEVAEAVSDACSDEGDEEEDQEED